MADNSPVKGAGGSRAGALKDMNASDAATDFVRVPKQIGIGLALLPVLLLGTAWILSDRFSSYDPTADFFGEFVGDAEAVNPVERYAPFRDNGSFVYLPTQEVPIRAVISGDVTSVQPHFIELRGQNDGEQEIVIRYFGLRPTTSVSNPVLAGSPVGVGGHQGILVQFSVGGKAKLPPEELPVLPRAAKADLPGAKLPNNR